MTKFKKMIALLLSLVMFIGMLPMDALAEIIAVDTSASQQLGRSVVTPTTAAATYIFMNGDAEFARQIVKNGETLNNPGTPQADSANKEFVGWYVGDAQLTFPYTASVTDTTTVTVNAKYEDVYFVFFTNPKGDVMVTKKGVKGDVITTADVTYPVGNEESITGWKNESGATVSSVTLNDADVTLTAIVTEGHWITYDSQGGSYVEPAFVKGGETSVAPTAPTRLGYTFSHWSTTENGSAFTFGSTLAGSLTLYAVWTANTKVSYTVVFWQQKVTDAKDAADSDKTYDYVSSETRTGTTGATVTPTYADQNKNYTGFDYNSSKSVDVTVKADGSTVLNVYYDRQLRTIEFREKVTTSFGQFQTTSWELVTTIGDSGRMTGLYGSTLAQNGYTFPTLTDAYWREGTSNSSQEQTMVPAFIKDDKTYELYKHTDKYASYTKYHYQEQLDGTWQLVDTVKATSAGLKFTNKYAGFTVYQWSTDNASWKSVSESATGLDPIHVRHSRNSYNLEFKQGNNAYYAGNPEAATTQSVKFEAQLSEYANTVPSRPSGLPSTYVFDGWYADPACSTEFDFTATMPANNVAVYAKWVAPTFTGTAHKTTIGGDDSIEITDIPYGGTIADQLNELQEEIMEGKDGYAWHGWRTGPNGTGEPFNVDTMIYSNIILYPYYTKVGTYSVTYVTGKADVTAPVDSKAYAEDSYADLMSPGALKSSDGQYFLGWSDGTTLYQPRDKYQIKGDVKFTAVWGDRPASVTLTYKANGGTGNDKTYTYANNETVTTIQNPFTREGYTFVGWDTSDTGAGSIEVGAQVQVDSNGENILYAIWKANTNTPYKVEHYLEKLDGNGYTLKDTENLTGTTDTTATATPKSYEGFTFDKTVEGTLLSGNIAGDGSLVLKLYYKRNTYKVTYAYTGSVPTDAPALPEEASYKYEQKVSVAAAPTLAGYTFSGWSTTDATVTDGKFSMPAKNVAIQGSWTAKGDTKYTVEFYYQNTDGTYPETASATETRTGTTGTLASVTEEDKADKKNGKYVFDENNENKVLSGTIAGDGKLVLKLYFKLNTASYTIHHYLLDTTVKVADDETGTKTIGETLTAAASTARYEGYAYAKVDSYSPSQTITIDADATKNVITVYYKVTLTLTGESATKTYTGSEQSITGITPVGLLTGHAYSGLTYEAKGTNVGTYTGAFSGDVVIRDADGTDVTENYVVTKTPGALTITAIETEIVITANSESKTYDGTALTNSGYTYTEKVLVEGDELTAVVEGSQTDVGSSANVVKSYKVMRGDVDVTKNYTFGDSVNGTLTVTKRKVTFTGETADKTYTGSEQSITGITQEGLLIGHTYENLTYIAKGTNVGEYDGAFSGDVVIKDANGVEVTKNYDVKTETGKLTIKNASLAVTFTGESATKTYTGSEQTITSITQEGLLTGHTYESLTYVAKGTNVGEYNGVFSGDVVIKDANGTDVTENYVVTKTPGVLTINKAPIGENGENITLTPVDAEKVYDGTALESGVATATDKHGNTVKIEYSVDGKTWTEDASTITATNVSDSTTIQVRASGTNYEGYVTGTQKLKITKRPVTITANNNEVEYDGDAHGKNLETAYTVAAAGENSGLVSGHKESSVNIAFTAVNVGVYTELLVIDKNAVKIMNGEADVTANYDIAVIPGTLTITGDKLIPEKKAEDEAIESNYKLGEKIEFTITVKNVSKYEVKEIVVTDANAEIQAGTGYTVSEDKHTATIASLAAASEIKITAKHTVTSEDILAGKVGNTANVTWEDTTRETGDETEKLVEPDVTLEVEKTSTWTGKSEGTLPELGTEITYTIKVTNKGNVPYTNVKFTDTLQSGSETVTGTIQEYGTLAVNETKSFTVKHIVTEADLRTGSIHNEVTATADEITYTYYEGEEAKTKKVTPTDTDDVTDSTTEAAAQLTSVKTTTSTPANKEAYALGEKITYTITVTNSGNQTVTNVKVTENLAGAVITAGTGYTLADGVAVIATLEPDSSVVVNAEYVVTEADILAGKVVNDATVTGEDPNGPDPDSNEPETDDPTDTPKATMTITKAVESDPVNGVSYALGEKITYTLTVSIGTENNVTVEDIKVTDTLLTAENVTNGVVEIAGGYELNANNEIELPDMAPGAADVVITYTYTVQASDLGSGAYGNVHNEATVSGTTPEPDDPEDQPDDPTDSDDNDTRTNIALTITAKDNTVEYDGQKHGHNGYTNTSLANGDTISALMMSGGQTNAGVYEDELVPSNARIMSADGKTEVTSQYDITYVPGTLTITKRGLPDPENPDDDSKLVKIIAEDNEVEYDGKAHGAKLNADGEYEAGISYTTTRLAEGHSVKTVTISGSQKNVGVYENELVPSNATIVDADGNDVTSNYELTYVPGDLTITKKPLTITAASASKEYDGTRLIAVDCSTGANQLAEGDELKSFNISGAITDVGSVPNVVSGAVIKIEGSDEDVTANYEITYVPGTLTITKRGAGENKVKIIANDNEVEYDGKAHGENGYTTEYLAEGHRVETVTISGSQTNVGEYKDELKPSNATIVDADGNDVTSNYVLTYVPGDLTITGDKLIPEKKAEDEAIESNYKLGDEIEFTITVKNVSKYEVKDIVVTDANAEIQAGTGYTVSTDKHTATIESLAAASEIKITAKHTVTSEDILAGKVGNTANVTWEDTTRETGDETEKLVKPDVMLEVEKTSTWTGKSDGKVPELGTEITYTIKVTNKGNVPYTNVKFTDTLQSGSETVTGTIPEYGTLAVNETKSFTVTHTVTEADLRTGSIHNEVTATADEITYTYYEGEEAKTGKATPTDTDDVKDSTTEAAAKLTSVKTTTSTPANKEAYALGEKITYTITVTNSGNQTVTNVQVTENLAGAVITAGTGYTLADGVAVIATLEPGSSVVVNAEYVVKEADILAGKVVNDATVTGKDPNGPDPDPNEPETDDPTDTPKATMTITKAVDGDPANGVSYALGEKITYTLTVSIGTENNVTVEDIKVTDTLLTAENVTNGVVEIEGGYELNANNEIELPDMAPGAADVVITYTYKVQASDLGSGAYGNVHNEATVSGTTPEPDDPEDQPDDPTDSDDDDTRTNIALTITANDNTVEYDGQKHGQNGYTNTSLANGNTISALTMRGGQTNAGVYKDELVPSNARIMSADGKTEVTSQYDITYVPGTLTITKRGLPDPENPDDDSKRVKIIAEDNEVEYDGKAHGAKLNADGEYEAGISYTTTRLAEGHSVKTVNISGSQTNVGVYENELVPSNATIVDADGNDVTSNYVLTYVSGDLTITKRPLTITAASASKEYDGTALTKNSYTNTALAEGDEITSVTITGSITDVGSKDNVASAAVIKAGEEDVTANYAITYVNGTLTITQSTKELKVVANSNSWQYDGKQHADGGYKVTYGDESYTVAAGESATLSTDDKVTAVITKQVKNVADTATGNNEIVTLTVENEEQYKTITKEAGTLTITQRPIEVSDELETRYNGRDQTLTIGTNGTRYTVTGLVDGETLSLNATITGRTAGEYTTLDGTTETNPTPYTWSVTKADGTTDSTGNYTIDVTGKLTIQQAEAKIQFFGPEIERVYNGAERAFTTTEVVKDADKAEGDAYILVTGLVENDTVVAGTIQHTVAGTNVGTYNGEFVYSGAHAPEGETNPTPTIMNGNLDVTDSYTFAEDTVGKLTIMPRPVEITANDNTVEYDGMPHGVNETTPYTVTPATADNLESGLVTGHEFRDVEIAFTATAAGKYENKLEITQEFDAEGALTQPSIYDGSGDSATDVTKNYAVTFKPGTLTITTSTKPLVITSESKKWVYDGEAHTYPVYTVTYDGTTITAEANTDGKTFTLPTGDKLTITPDETAKVQFVEDNKPENNTFTYTIKSGEDDRKDSYSEVQTNCGTLSIGKRKIAIKAADHEWEYDGKDHEYKFFNVAEWIDVNQSDPEETDWHLVTGTDGKTARVEYSVKDDVKLITLDKIVHTMSDVQVEGSIKYVGTADNVPKADTVVIMRGSGEGAKDVTANYEFVKLYNGTLTIIGDPLDPEKTIVKEDPDKKYDFGDKIQFTITVQNTTTQTLTNVTVYDETAEIDLPAGDNFAYGDNKHTVFIKSIASGETITLTAWHTVTEADITQKIYKNEVVTEVEYGNKDWELTADETTTDLEPPVKSLKITKELVDGLDEGKPIEEGRTYKAGETAYFKITVENTGNQTVTGITVTEVSSQLTGEAKFIDDETEWTIDSLAPKASTTRYAYYEVTEADLANNEKCPTNVVTAKTTDDTPDPNPGTEEIPLPEPVTLTIHYLFADGTTAFPDYVATLRPGMPYSVLSPVLEGYLFRTPVEGVMPDEDHVEIVRYIPEGGGGGGGEGGEDEEPDEQPRNVTTLLDYPTPLGLSNVFMNVCDCFE